MKAWNPWSVEEVNSLRLNYGKVPVSRISESLNRSRPAIRAKALKLGLVSEINLNKIWTEEEDQILIQEFVPDKTVVISIAKKLGRSRDSVYRRAWSKNLCRKYDSRQRHLWSEEETQLLQEQAGNPVSCILKTINAWRINQGLEKRSKTAIERKLMSLSISRKCEGSYFDVPTLVEVLRCSRFVIYKWAHDYKEVLKPHFEGEGKEKKHYLFHVSNLKKFFVNYPGEVAKTKPDITWLITIISSK